MNNSAPPVSANAIQPKTIALCFFELAHSYNSDILYYPYSAILNHKNHRHFLKFSIG